MRIINDPKLDFKDVLIVPKRSTLNSRSEVSLLKTYTFRNSGLEWTGIPIMASNMDGVGEFGVAEKLSDYQLPTCIVKHKTKDEWVEKLKEYKIPRDVKRHFIVSCGISKDDFNNMIEVITAVPELQFICVDVANGYSQGFLGFVKSLRDKIASVRSEPITIIAGNVVTPEMTEELLLSGADIVKVGIGPGSVCTTRFKTGVGYPQLSAIIECADAAHGLNGHIIADGGCTSPGDIAKAFGAGADFVMLGGMLAGHDEGGGERATVNGVSGFKFYGMSSKDAMLKHKGSIAEYRASEGKSVFIPEKYSLTETVREILGGVRSACTYAGAKTLKDLPKCTTFVRVTQQLNNVFGETK